MKQAFTIAAAGLLSWLAPAEAAAQAKLGPWVDVPNAPQIGFSGDTRVIIRVVQPGVVWATYYNDLGMGIRSNAIINSADNGESWQDGFLPWLRDFWAIDAQTAWAISDSNLQLLKTSTGSAGFALAPGPPPVTPLCVRFFNPTVGVVVGSAANTSVLPIYRTTDGGASWQPVPGVPAITPASSLGPSQTGVVLGNNIWVLLSKGQLLHSADAGLTWSLTPIAADILSLDFRDARHGLAYTLDPNYLYGIDYQSTTLYRTADGGATWSLVQANLKLHSSNIAAVPGSAGTYLNVGGNWFTHENSGTAISYDEGRSWQELGGGEPLRGIATNGRDTWANNPINGKLRRLGSTVLAATAAAPAAAALAYPNPTTGLVHLPAAGPYRTATVYDATGRRCRTVPLGPAETSLDLGGLGAGLYLLHLAGGPAAPSQQRLVVQP